MNKKRKVILVVGILLVTISIIILSLLLYLDKKVRVNIFTIAEISDNRIYAANIGSSANQRFSFDQISLQDASLNEIDKNNVKVGDYIYLYIKDAVNFTKNTSFYCQVKDISDTDITVEMPEWQYFSFNIENAKIKDIDGKKVDISNLKEGYTIKTVNIQPKYVTDIAMIYDGSYCSPLYDVKSVRIINTDEKTKEKLENRNMLAVKTVIVAKLNENGMYVIDINNQNNLYYVYYPEIKTTEFEIGQEVKIYFNGKSNLGNNTGIEEIKNVGKIEATNNSAKYDIPDNILKRINTTYNKVEVKIENITNRGLTLTINDKNDIKYEFAKKFYLSKNITEKPENSMIEYENGSVAILPYEGEKWQLLYATPDDIENIITKETIDENNSRWTFSWEKVYDSLGSGEYKMVIGDAGNDPNRYFTNDYDRDMISIKFTVDDNGVVTDYEVIKGS